MGRTASRLRARLRRLAAPGNRMVLTEMVRANIKASDYHSFLGGMWSLLGTAAMLAAMYFVFNRRFGAGIPSYPLYVLVGIVMVNFFITATLYLEKVLVLKRDVALNSTIPRENLLLATISINTWKLAIELAICAALSAGSGLLDWRSALLLLPLLLSFLGLVLGIGLALGLFYCFARDVDHAWAILSRLFLFITPVFYTPEGVSPRIRLLVLYLNPLTPFVRAFRAVFIRQEALTAPLLAHCLLLGPVALALAYLFFLRWEGAALDRT